VLQFTHPLLNSEFIVTRLSLLFWSAVVAGLSISVPSQSQAADPPETRRVKAIRETVLPAKIKLDIDKKMLRPIIFDDLPAAIKEVTKLTVKIDVAPGQGVTLTSSFELKGEMTVAEALDKLCADKSWGWYVNVAKEGDQKDGSILLTTNSKEHGYKEGTGPMGKEVAKKEDPKTKEKPKDEPKATDADKAAAELLTKAKFQISTKQSEKAKTTLNEIIEKYPDTKSAADAKKLLEKIGK
jgi:hypothetical protein